MLVKGATGNYSVRLYSCQWDNPEGFGSKLTVIYHTKPSENSVEKWNDIIHHICANKTSHEWVLLVCFRRWLFLNSLEIIPKCILRTEEGRDNVYCSGSAGASVVAHGVALPLYRDCFLDLRLFNSPDLRRLVLCYCCQAWTLETVLGGNTALPRWWTARSIDADAKR